MSDFLTAADALLLTPFVMGCGFLLACAVAVVARRERRTRATFTAEALDLAHSGGIPPCAATRGLLTCDRPQGHPGGHLDSTRGRDLGDARWTA